MDFSRKPRADEVGKDNIPGIGTIGGCANYCYMPGGKQAGKVFMREHSVSKVCVSKGGAVLQELQRAIHYHFAQVKLLETALTHSSYANERGGQLDNNERLEFLGDAALELAISTELFLRNPGVREGELTRMRAKLVSQPSLAELALKCRLDRHLLLGKGEEHQGGRERPSLLSDAMEAIWGAIYLDGGIEGVKKSVAGLYEGMWPQPGESEPAKDCKSQLQEVTQRLFKERPVYALLNSYGPEHSKVFVVQVTLPDGRVFTSEGSSLKRAEQQVAQIALDILRKEETGSR